MKKLRTFDEYMQKELQNPKQMESYLRISLEEYEKDGDAHAFLIALKRVIKACGGVTELAEKSDLNREHLYRMLSGHGNPTLTSITRILHTLGFQLSVERIHRFKKAA